MTTLIFVRHGLSEANLAQIFTGQVEAELTPLGKEQAMRTAEYLREYPIDLIYASDLRRAVQTAEPTASMHGLEIVTDPLLREISAGEWEGQPYEVLRTRYPRSYALWLEDVGHAQPDGGERAVGLAGRVIAETDRIVRANRGACIAVFSHATPLRAMGCRWFGYPPDEMSRIRWVPNASVSIAEYYDDGSIQVLQFGYDGHQGGLSTTIPKGLV